MGTLSEQPPWGIVRNLTEVFVLLRNNAVQSRHIFAGQTERHHAVAGEDKMSLIPLESAVGDAERGAANSVAARTPPDWVSVLDEVQYEISRVRTRLRELKELQTAHVGRPAFSDDASGADEARIERATEEVGRLLAHCRKLVQHVEKHEANVTRRCDRLLIRNAVASLYATAQCVTVDFRSQQNNYLRQVRSSTDSLQHYFDESPTGAGGSASFGEFFDASTSQQRQHGGSASAAAFDDFASAEGSGSGSAAAATGEMSLAQIQLVEHNSQVVREREREIVSVSKSIVEVNQLFKDLAEMIVDQGSVLDRIDYNIEQTDMRVKSALEDVEKAERYQRKNKKLMCIMILAALIIIFAFLLFFG